MAAVYSLLKHASWPESIFFHFLAAETGAAGGGGSEPELLRRVDPVAVAVAGLAVWQARL
jgi:hypothetical protein